jgi:hypothetical protein
MAGAEKLARAAKITARRPRHAAALPQLDGRDVAFYRELAREVGPCRRAAEPAACCSRRFLHWPDACSTCSRVEAKSAFLRSCTSMRLRPPAALWLTFPRSAFQHRTESGPARLRPACGGICARRRFAFDVFAPRLARMAALEASVLRFSHEGEEVVRRGGDAASGVAARVRFRYDAGATEVGNETASFRMLVLALRASSTARARTREVEIHGAPDLSPISADSRVRGRGPPAVRAGDPRGAPSGMTARSPGRSRRDLRPHVVADRSPTAQLATSAFWPRAPALRRPETEEQKIVYALGRAVARIEVVAPPRR